VAIYSLNHSAIGRTTHADGTAGAHIRYITRAGAEPVVLAHLIPEDRNQARSWMNHHEQESRKNGRVCDKLIFALPVELNPQQRAALLRDFAHQVTDGGKIPWYAAIHQESKDLHNPHAHLILVDRDPDTGKRVIKTTDKGSTERFRLLWEETANDHLKKAGFEVRIDRRTLEAQGIDRTPTIHVGPGAQIVVNEVKRPESKTGLEGRKKPYAEVDQGKTRQEFNNQIIDFNLEKLRRSPDPAERERAKAIQIERTRRFRLLQERHERAQDITRAMREKRAALWVSYRAASETIKIARAQQEKQAASEVRKAYRPEWAALLSSQKTALAEFEKNEGSAQGLASNAQKVISLMKRGEDFEKGYLTKIFDAAKGHMRKKLFEQHQAQERRELFHRQTEAIKSRTLEAIRPYREAAKENRLKWDEARKHLSEETRAAWTVHHRQSAAESRSFEANRDAGLSSLAKAFEAGRRGEGKPSPENRPAPSGPGKDRGLGR